MAKATKAFSLGISVLIVIALVLVVDFGIFVIATTTNLTNSTPCNTVASANYPPDQILQHKIENDPDFIAAEHGLNYYVTGPPGCGDNLISGSETIYFYFAYTTNKLYTSNCGGIYNITDYLTVKVPLTQTGYNISAIEITPTNSSQQITTCTTSVATSNEDSDTVPLDFFSICIDGSVEN